MTNTLRLLLLCALLATFGIACDAASPTAPTGSILTISASPTLISLNGTSQITVIGRKPDGNPFNQGTEVRLSSNRGTIDTIVNVDSTGIARAVYRADGRTGTATITATTGDGTSTATVDIQVGQSPESRPNLVLSVSPNNIPVEGTAEITVIARNPDGSAVAAGQAVILTSTLGSISPNRPVTRGDGTAVATLRAGSQAGTSTITAILGSSDPATTSVTIRDAATDISLQANPATVPPSGGTIELTAFVTNSQGQPLQGAPVTFGSERGTLANSGVVFTNTNGVAVNMLTVSQEQLQSTSEFDVVARTPSGTGDQLDDFVTIRVQ